MPSSHLLQFIGGLTFFFFGLYTLHQSLVFFAGDRLKEMIAKTGESSIRSLFTGIIVTFFLQSSSAVTVMASSLTSSGLITLTQAMAIALGAGIGTTFVVLLISIKEIVQWGLLIVAIGLFMKVLASRRSMQVLGEIIFGFGFVFFGLTVMSQASEPLKTYPLIIENITALQSVPIANFLIALVITALVHSSGVVMGILISLAYTHAISFEMAIPLILGANVGTAITAITTSFKGNEEGKRAAWANFLLRMGGVLILLPFANFFLWLLHFCNEFIMTYILQSSVTTHGQIALTHFFFNFFLALVFLPFLPLGKKIVCWLIPEDPNKVEPFGAKYLDKNALETPSLGFAQVRRELVRMGEIVQTMLEDCLKLFDKYDLDYVDELRQRDNKVDKLYKAIKFYLARFSYKNLKEEEQELSIQLMTAVNELEAVGDVIDRQIIRLARKKSNKGFMFSNQGWKEICELHAATTEMLEFCLAAIATSNDELVLKMRSHEAYYSARIEQLKQSHLMRLNQGLQESIDTSAIHLELLSLFNQINISLLSMAEYMLPQALKMYSEDL